MPRGLVALFALLEASFVVGLGIVIPFVLGLVGWASLAGIHATPLDVWRLSVQTWALGHGVPLSVTLGDASTVLTDSLATFDLSLAPFVFAIVTLLLGRRAGRRVAGSEDASRVLGLLVVFVAVFVALILLSARSATVELDVFTGTIRILTPFVVGLLAGWKPWEFDARTRFLIPEIPSAWRDVVDAGIRVSSATLVLLIAIGSLVIASLMVVGFTTEISLYESLHTGILGGLVITAAQLAATPVAVVWAIGWIAGPGFSLGSGSLVSPFSATVGAVPAIPLLGAIPSTPMIGWWVTLVPGIVALIVGARFADHVGHGGPAFTLARMSDVGRIAAAAGVAALATLFGVVIVGGYASGSAGPGRFAHVGIEPLVVAAVLAAGVFVGSFLGFAMGKVARDAQQSA